jgi:serine/threonine protein phosphatase PrpC
MLNAEEIAETLGRAETPERIVERLIAIANAAGGMDNIAALVIECAGGHEHARPADSAPMPPGGRSAAEQTPSDPELLILGIEELDATPNSEKTDDLVKQLGELFGWSR